MSVKAMNWAWTRQGLKASQKLVLLKLADHANDDGLCWPGKGSLCDTCGMSKRALDGILHYLADQKLISVERRRGVDNERRNETNAYQLHIGQEELFSGAESAPPRAKTALGQNLPYGKNGRGVVQKSHESSAESAPESKSNHHIEPPSAARAGAREAAAIDYENWQPDDTLLARIRQTDPDVTDRFIEQIRLEFVTYAEDNGYREGQMRSRFIGRVHAKWIEAKQREGNRGPLRTVPADLRDVHVDQLESWSRARDGPPPAPGESAEQYRERIARHLSSRETREYRNPAIDRLAAAASVT